MRIWFKEGVIISCKNKFNFVCIVPVRKFETFYFSKIKAKFNSTKITKEFLKKHGNNGFIKHPIIFS